MPDLAAEMQLICRNILTTTLRLRRGENVIVESWTHMLPWANALVLEARRLGIRPTLLYEDEETYWRAVAECKPADLGKMPEPELGAIAKANGYVFLWGPADRPRLRALPKEQYAALTGYNGRWYEAAEKAHLRGCRWELGQATPAAAAFYGVNETAWQRSLIDAAQVDLKRIAKEAARLATRLRGGKRLRVTHANGSALEFHLLGRKPVIDDGIVDAEDIRAGNNMTSVPGGAVYVAVDERFVEGKILANRTSFPVRGALAGGRWTFAGNVLSEYEYASGQDRFQEAYEAAPVGKDRPGFVSIGLNPGIRVAPGMEDFERGTVLVGIGSNGAFGGKTQIPFQSWLALASAHVEVDGKTVVADGEIL